MQDSEWAKMEESKRDLFVKKNILIPCIISCILLWLFNAHFSKSSSSGCSVHTNDILHRMHTPETVWEASYSERSHTPAHIPALCSVISICLCSHSTICTKHTRLQCSLAFPLHQWKHLRRSRKRWRSKSRLRPQQPIFIMKASLVSAATTFKPAYLWKHPTHHPL